MELEAPGYLPLHTGMKVLKYMEHVEISDERHKRPSEPLLIYNCGEVSDYLVALEEYRMAQRRKEEEERAAAERKTTAHMRAPHINARVQVVRRRRRK